MKCCKCKDDAKGGATMVEGGDTFIFCKACYSVLENTPTGFTISAFLGEPKKGDWIEKRIKSARLRREKGEGLWKEPLEIHKNEENEVAILRQMLGLD